MRHEHPSTSMRICGDRARLDPFSAHACVQQAIVAALAPFARQVDVVVDRGRQRLSGGPAGEQRGGIPWYSQEAAWPRQRYQIRSREIVCRSVTAVRVPASAGSAPACDGEADGGRGERLPVPHTARRPVRSRRRPAGRPRQGEVNSSRRLARYPAPGRPAAACRGGRGAVAVRGHISMATVPCCRVTPSRRDRPQARPGPPT